MKREDLMKGRLCQNTDKDLERALAIYGNDWTKIELYLFKRSGGDIEKEAYDPHCDVSELMI
jgi:hypothetical protein